MLSVSPTSRRTGIVDKVHSLVMDKQGYVWISKPQKYFLYILPKLGRKLFSCSPANIQKPLQKVPLFTHVLENRILDNRTHKMG